MAGSAYTLSHALNKQKGIQAVNSRAASNYINYPSIADVRHYTVESCTNMIYNADTVVFHCAVKPYYSAYKLDPSKMKGKKKLLYFHGTECRQFGKDILKQADELMQDEYEVLISTPDLFQYVPTAHWLPVARSFQETKERFGLCGQDHKALKTLIDVPPKTTLGHAPTNQQRKGSATFFKVITELIQTFPHLEYQVIQNMTWDSCLRALSKVNIYYDQAISGAYGLAAVEASIFGASVFCYLNEQVMDVMEKESHLPNPFIQWADDDVLRTQSFMIVQDPKLQRKFGKMAYDYCKIMHDEEPVAKRFLKIVEAM